MGVVLFGINPVFAFIQRFVPRLLDGICLGYIFRGMRKVSNTYVACAVTGFFSAFLNTLFFMAALVGLFGNTEYVKNQKYHVYKRIEKIYNNPHPGSGVV